MSAEPAYVEDSAAEAGFAGDDGRASSGEIQTPQHVIVEGWMTVVVDEPTEVTPTVTQIVAGAGGYVESRSEQAPTDDRAGRANLVLRIPSDRLDETLDAIEQLGRLSTRETSSTDVTLAVTDLDARIEALEVSIDRLLAMLADAQRTEDLITLERTLQERQGELESMRAQRTVLGARVALATIDLTLTTDPPPPSVGPGGFWPGVVAGWNSLVDTLRVASVVIGMLLPWLVFFGILGTVVVVLVRRARRNRPPRPQAPAAQPPSPAQHYAYQGYAAPYGASGATAYPAPDPERADAGSTQAAAQTPAATTTTEDALAPDAPAAETSGGGASGTAGPAPSAPSPSDGAR